MKKYDFHDNLLSPLLVVDAFVEASTCSVSPTIWLRLSEEAWFFKTSKGKGVEPVQGAGECREQQGANSGAAEKWSPWCKPWLVFLFWFDNQSNRNHPAHFAADKLQLLLIFSFTANVSSVIAGCLCFNSFTFEDDLIWKKYICGTGVHLINSDNHPQHNREVTPRPKHLLQVLIWDCTNVHPVCTLRINWLECTLALFSLLSWAPSICTQVKLTTIHPFTVDTGLAKKPRSRLLIKLEQELKF